MISRSTVVKNSVVTLAMGSLLTVATIFAQDVDDKPDRTNRSRLRAMREILAEIKIESLVDGDDRDLKISPDPLFRYNDVSRGIADSTIWRIGTEGRPSAIITAELYGRNGNVFLLNHEFVALDDPRIRLQRDIFVWKPPEGALEFQTISGAAPPAEKPTLRLTQMKRLAQEFTATEQLGQTQIPLRGLPTPIDRYAPSAQPGADGAIFAFVWGLNPEALLFIESDGTNWTFAWTRLGAAKVWAERDEALVWELPAATEHEHPTATYTSIHRSVTVPPYFDEESAPESGPAAD